LKLLFARVNHRKIALYCDAVHQRKDPAANHMQLMCSNTNSVQTL
jgi:hypothetical protein